VSDDVKQRESQTLQEHELPEGWTVTTISEITEPVKKVKPEEKPKNRFIYLDISSIDNEDHRITDPKNYKGADAPSRARQLVAANDVLFSTVRTYLRNVALVPEVYDGEIASTGFCVLRGNSTVLPGYLFYYALTDDFISELSTLQRGTSYPAVRDEDVHTRTIPLPPLPEQHRIVDAIETQFTRLDAAVAALERAQANLARYRASVLQAAVEGRLVPTEADLAREEGRDYEPADALLERILEKRRARWEAERWQYEIERAKKKTAQAERKAAGLPYYIRQLPEASWIDRAEEEYAPYLPKSDTWKQKYDEPEPLDTEDLPELPEGWRWTSFGRAFEVHVGATPRRTKPEYWNGEVSWVKSGEVAFCRIQETEETITKEGLRNTSTDVHPPGTVLLGMIGEGKTRGQAAILDIPAAHNQNCAAIRVSETEIPPEYVYYFLEGRYERTRTMGSGNNQPALNKGRVESMTIPLPPLAEQRRIVKEVERRLSVVDALEDAVEANLTRAERLRQAILKTAFEGRLVDQNPDDEPASALLGRTQAERDA
jgi:type I restriction enzyme S subunit